MTLIKCKECNKEISDKAETCPHCGITLKKKKTVKEAKIIKENGQRTTCTKCGNMLYVNSKFCTKCGKSIEEMKDDDILYLKYCPKCNSNLFMNQKFCSGCGSNITELEELIKNSPRCSNCNSILKDNQKFCINCGKEI